MFYVNHTLILSQFQPVFDEMFVWIMCGRAFIWTDGQTWMENERGSVSTPAKNMNKFHIDRTKGLKPVIGQKWTNSKTSMCKSLNTDRPHRETGGQTSRICVTTTQLINTAKRWILLFPSFRHYEIHHLQCWIFSHHYVPDVS